MDRAGQVEALHGAFFSNLGKQSLIVVYRILDFDTDGMGVSEKRTLERDNEFLESDTAFEDVTHDTALMSRSAFSRYLS